MTIGLVFVNVLLLLFIKIGHKVPFFLYILRVNKYCGLTNFRHIKSFAILVLRFGRIFLVGIILCDFLVFVVYSLFARLALHYDMQNIAKVR